MAVFQIVEFLFQTLGELFYVMNQFEIFPGVKFGYFVIALSILNIVLKFVFDNLYSDAINYDNSWERGSKRIDYVGKHTPEGYKPKHAESRKIKGIANPFYKRKH